jgi:hypothetical protein
MPDSFGIFSPHERAHRFCKPVADSIISFHHFRCPNLPIVDYGCGDGSYVNSFLENGILAIGIEGISQDINAPVIEINLCEPVCFYTDRMSVSLEVAEHIPAKYMEVFLTTITRGAKFVALSWAIRGQHGLGHVNCLNNHEVIAQMQKMGFDIMIDETDKARASIPSNDSCPWFKNTFFFFKSRI